MGLPLWRGKEGNMRAGKVAKAVIKVLLVIAVAIASLALLLE